LGKVLIFASVVAEILMKLQVYLIFMEETTNFLSGKLLPFSFMGFNPEG